MQDFTHHGGHRCAGPSLLRLPVVMLERVSKHLTAQELAQGLLQTCSLLYHMQLPRIAMKPLLPRHPLYVGCLPLYC